MIVKTWIYFKLRMLQLRYDKTALFFSYFLPIILLMGIGYPVEMSNKKSVQLHIVNLTGDVEGDGEVNGLIQSLDNHTLIKTFRYTGTLDEVNRNIKEGRVQHALVIHNKADKSSSKYELLANDTNDKKVQSMMISSVIREALDQKTHLHLVHSYLGAGSLSSYIVILLPGLIGMTLLTIGLNGFGGVIIVERNEGLFRNIKTVDASPSAFLLGLFLSRLFICYSVAAALFLVGVLLFDLTIFIDYLSLFVIVTLGCVSFLGIGLVIAVLSRSVSAFNGVVNFVNIPFVVFSGVFFSTSAFPNWLQMATQIIPLTHMNTAIKNILFSNGNILNGQIDKELVALLLWCIVTVAFGLKKFKW